MGVVIKLNSPGVRALLKSPGVQADLKRRGTAIQKAAGSGISIAPWVGRNRARVSILTRTPQAKRAEADHRTLTKAIDAGRR